MRRSMTRFGFGMLLLPALGAAQTTVQARLLTPLSSYRTKSGTPITALLTTPLCQAAGRHMAQGATLEGAVRRVHKVGLGLLHETAGMRIEFHEIRLPDGRTLSLDARLSAIANARERVDKHGGVHGIRATATLSNRLGERLVLAAFGHPMALMPLFALETSLVHFPEPEIDYPSGTEIEVVLDFPGELAGLSACAVAEPFAGDEESSFGTLIAALPVWAYAKTRPQDAVNLVYIGSEEQVRAAFTAAGWTGQRQHSAAAGWGAMRAIAENRAYRDAPMRDLLLDGEVADLSVQKTLDTFEKRDHLRIWRRPQTWEGREVWASAATRDVATSFSFRPFGFTHRIQNDIDQERDKVVQDLKFTGCVDSVSLVPRPDPGLGTDGRRGVRTDGRVAVVFLNACQEPHLDIAGPGSVPPPLVVRSIRRITLTARNHFLRDNIFYRSGDAARIGVEVFRDWLIERKAAAAHQLSVSHPVKPM